MIEGQYITTHRNIYLEQVFGILNLSTSTYLLSNKTYDQLSKENLKVRSTLCIYKWNSSSIPMVIPTHTHTNKFQ